MYKYVMFVLLSIALSACAEVSVGQAKATFHIVDGSGHSVSNATVDAWFRWSYEYEDVKRFTEITDTNGIVSCLGELGPELSIRVYKDGWYESTEVLNWKKYFSDSKVVGGKWQPWNPTIEIVLKEKKNPIPLIVRNFDEAVLPLENEPVGFDLFEGDWVAPFGKGKIADLIVIAENDYRGFRDLDVRYSISFDNPKDGFIRFESQKYGSDLVSSQEAPESGYEGSFTAHYGRKGNERSGGYDDENVNYYFRIRTKTDDEGNIISCHYGKIYRGIVMAPWNEGGLRLSLLYYLNPKSNDRNVEYDVKTNLAKDDAAPGERRNSVYSVNQP
jgi:hypothetical protein